MSQFSFYNLIFVAKHKKSSKRVDDWWNSTKSQLFYYAGATIPLNVLAIKGFAMAEFEAISLNTMSHFAHNA